MLLSNVLLTPEYDYNPLYSSGFKEIARHFISLADRQKLPHPSAMAFAIRWTMKSVEWFNCNEEVLITPFSIDGEYALVRCNGRIIKLRWANNKVVIHKQFSWKCPFSKVASSYVRLRWRNGYKYSLQWKWVTYDGIASSHISTWLKIIISLQVYNRRSRWQGTNNFRLRLRWICSICQ